VTEIEDYRGVIPCPYCNEKTMVKKNARGQASHRCKCGKIIMFDYDKMTAIPMKPIRGAAKYFRDKTIKAVTD